MELGERFQLRSTPSVKSSSILIVRVIRMSAREEIERLLENITILAEAVSLATSAALTDELVSHWRADAHPAIC